MARQTHAEGAPAERREGSRAFINRLANPLVRTLLRSPLHRLLSGNTMLITVRGRKTGREYTTPVNYVRDGVQLTVVSRRDRTWWRNVAGGARVTLRLRGKDVTARAEVAPAGGYDLIPAYMAYREKLGHPVSATTAEMTARDIVMVQVELDEDAS